MPLTDAAERGQSVLTHYAEPQGGNAREAGIKWELDGYRFRYP